MTPDPVKTASIDDVTLAYRESGSGYPVIFISGLASTMDMWNPPVLDRIAEKFRVIIFDHRGTGYSGTSERPFSVPLLAGDTAGLMDALGIPSAHIIGLSMGASIAQELALTYPDRVSRLVLVAGECGGTEAVRMPPEVLARLMDRSGTVQDVTRRMFSLLFPPAWLARHDPFRSCPEVYETVSGESMAHQAAAFFSWTGSCSRLPGLRQPTLVITGTDDIIVPPVNSRIMSRQIPGAELVEIPGAGHGLMYQLPDQFCTLVLGFFEH
jgi:pimeloyl-ACP methyl ester carboxylesterase